MKTIIALMFVFMPFNEAFNQINPDTSRALSILQSRGEVVLKFPRTDSLPLNKLTLMVSIDRVEKDSITAYLSVSQFQRFITSHIPFRIIEKKNLKSSLKSGNSIWSWNQYPTYYEYTSMMDSFAKTFPKLCNIENVGTTVKNRNILFAHINPDTTKAKPSVMYSSTMHGDETGGYVLMLHLIDYLLSNYNHNPNTTTLLDSLDIWINPLANPDGTYFNNTDVWQATRENGNGVDLNRNFPDPVQGLHPDDLAYQPETQAMMDVMGQRHFVLSANFHAGDEVVNYPWDSDSAFHADRAWFANIASEYADTVQHVGRKNYFTSVTSNGIVDGIYWYPVYGGRQDYITYFRQGRETTIELDAITKTTPEDSLVKLWNYNYRSFSNYLEQALYGFRGFVFDSTTQRPIKAKIELAGYDDNNSFVYSDLVNGSFYRPVFEGNYTLSVSADGYNSKEISGIQIQNKETKYFTFFLNANKNNIKSDDFSAISTFPNPCSKRFQILGVPKNEKLSVSIFTSTGMCLLSVPGKSTIDISNLANDMYFLRIQSCNKVVFKKIEVVH